MTNGPVGAQPRNTRGGGARANNDSQSSNGMVLLIAVPFLMFLMIFMTFSFAYHHYYLVVWGAVLAWVMLSFVFMLLDFRDRMGGQWYLFLGMLCCIACINASLAGLYNYQTHMYQYWSYDENRAYTNVLPSEPAGAHGDAGKIVFANTARVDTTRAVGFKAGSTYCVAPILDETQSDRVEFWAAGLNCCPGRGDFSCDDAWNPLAKSGVVILDSDGFFPAKRDYYLKAVKQSAAAFQLTISETPVLVRWVLDPQVIQDAYWSAGTTFLMWAKNAAKASGANT